MYAHPLLYFTMIASTTESEFLLLKMICKALEARILLELLLEYAKVHPCILFIWC